MENNPLPPCHHVPCARGSCCGPPHPHPCFRGENRVLKSVNSCPLCSSGEPGGQGGVCRGNQSSDKSPARSELQALSGRLAASWAAGAAGAQTPRAAPEGAPTEQSGHREQPQGRGVWLSGTGSASTSCTRAQNPG